MNFLSYNDEEFHSEEENVDGFKKRFSTHSPLSLNVPLMITDTLGSDFGNSIIPNMMNCHRKMQLIRMRDSFLLTLKENFKEEQAGVFMISDHVKIFGLILKNPAAIDPDTYCSIQINKGLNSWIASNESDFVGFLEINKEIRGLMLDDEITPLELLAIEFKNNSYMRYLFFLKLIVELYVVSYHSNNMNLDLPIYPECSGYLEMVKYWDKLINVQLDEHNKIIGIKLKINENWSIFLIDGCLVMKLEDNIDSDVHKTKRRKRQLVDDQSSFKPTYFCGSINILCCFLDTVSQRANASFITNVYFKRYDSIRSVRPDLLCHYYFIIDSMMLSFGNPIFNLLKDVETICVGSMIDKLEQDPLVNKGLFIMDTSDLTLYAAKKHMSTDIHSCYSLLFTFINQCSIDEMVEIYGTFRHHGHPIVEVDPSLQSLKEICNLEKDIRMKSVYEIMGFLNYSIIKSYFYKEAKWPPVEAHDWDEDLRLTPIPMSVSQILKDFSENNIPKVYSTDFLDYTRIRINKIYPLPESMRVLDLIGDKSITFDLERLSKYIIEKNSFGPSLDRRLLEHILQTDTINPQEFLMDIDDNGLDDNVNVIGLSSKEGELSGLSRLFAVTATELRLYFALTEDMISSYLLRTFHAITMLDSEVSLVQKILKQTGSYREVKIKTVSQKKSILYLRCSLSECNGLLVGFMVRYNNRFVTNEGDILNDSLYTQERGRIVDSRIPLSKPICNSCKATKIVKNHKNVTPEDKYTTGGSLITVPIHDFINTNQGGDINTFGNYILFVTHFSLDFTKWNRTFRNPLCEGPFKIFDALFGLKNCIARTHSILGRSYFFSADGIFRIFSPSQNNIREDSNRQWRGIKGGVEGLRQKGWTIITSIFICLIMKMLGFTFGLYGQGDNQILTVNIWANSKADYSSQVNNIVNQLSTQFEGIGLSLKPEETWSSRGLFVYGKNIYIKGVKVSPISKNFAKISYLSNDAIPTMEQCMSTINGGVNAAGTCTHSVSFTKLAGEYVTLMYLSMVKYVCPLMGIGCRDSIIKFLRIGVWKKYCNRGESEDNPKFNFLELLKLFSMVLSLLGPNLGGVNAPLLQDLFTRDYPDKLTGNISMLRILFDHGSIKMKKLIKSVDQIMVKSFRPEDTSERFMVLLESPEATHVMGNAPLSSCVRQKVEIAFTDRVIKNEFIRNKVVAALNKTDKNNLMGNLLKINPVFPRLWSTIYETTLDFSANQILNKFENSSTFLRLWVESSSFSKFSIELMINHINPLIYQEIKMSFNNPNSHQLGPMRKNRLYKMDFSKCPIDISNEIRLISFGKEILGVTTPNFLHTFFESKHSFDCNTNFLNTKDKDGFFLKFSSSMIKDLRNKIQGPYLAYLGSKTTEKTKNKLFVSFSKGSPVSNYFKLIQKIDWVMELDINTYSLLKMIGDSYGINLPAMSSFKNNICNNKDGNVYHRWEDSRTSHSGYVNTSYSSFNHVTISNNLFEKIARKGKSYAFQFQSQMCTALVIGADKRIRNPLSNIYSYFIPLKCHSCIREVPTEGVKWESDFSHYDQGKNDVGPNTLYENLLIDKVNLLKFVNFDDINENRITESYLYICNEVSFKGNTTNYPISMGRLINIPGFFSGLYCHFILDFLPLVLESNGIIDFTTLKTLNDKHKLREFFTQFLKRWIKCFIPYKSRQGLIYSEVSTRHIYDPNFQKREILSILKEKLEESYNRVNIQETMKEHINMYVSIEHILTVARYREKFFRMLFDHSFSKAPFIVSNISIRSLDIDYTMRFKNMTLCTQLPSRIIKNTYFTASSHMGYYLSTLIYSNKKTEFSLVGYGACCLLSTISHILWNHFDNHLINKVYLYDIKSASMSGSDDIKLNWDILETTKIYPNIELIWSTDTSGDLNNYPRSDLIIDDTQLKGETFRARVLSLDKKNQDYIFINRFSDKKDCLDHVMMFKKGRVYTCDHFEGHILIGFRLNVIIPIDHPGLTDRVAEYNKEVTIDYKQLNFWLNRSGYFRFKWLKINNKLDVTRIVGKLNNTEEIIKSTQRFPQIKALIRISTLLLNNGMNVENNTIVNYQKKLSQMHHDFIKEIKRNLEDNTIVDKEQFLIE